jgi:hypothetical protein
MEGDDALDAIFRHVDDDDLPWQEVKRQRNADGTTSSVREKWFAFRGDPPYLSLLGRYDPGMIVRRHGHRSPQVVYVIDGSIWCGDRLCSAGTHIELPEGAAFGPFRAGPDGVTMFEVMLGDPRSWGDRPELVDALRAEHGVEELPDPEIDLPAWLADERARWISDP